MSEELKKFTARWKTATKGLDGITSAEAEGMRHRCVNAAATCSTGYEQLSDDVLEAINSGIAGASIEDYAAYPAVRATLVSIKSLMADQLNEATAFTALRTKAAAALPDLETLSADIAKDLSKRKEKSKSKSDIEKLQGEVDELIADLKKIGKLPALKNRQLDPNLDYKSEVDAILKKSKAELESYRDETMLPQTLETKNLKRNVGEAVGNAKTAIAACDDAIAAAGAGDKAKALGAIKTARDAITEITTMVETYDKALTKYKDAVDASKDKATIEDLAEKITKAHAAADAKMRAAVAAVRGATWTSA